MLHPSVTAELAAVPFALSLFVFGMPHGAADGAVLRAAAAAPGRPRGWFVRVATGYLAVDAAALAVLLLAPAAALLAFLPLSVWHFGRTAADRDPAAPRLRGFAVHTLVVGLPFVFLPAESLALFDELASLAGAAAGAEVFPRWAVPAAAAACAVAGLALALDLAVDHRRRGRRVALLAALVAAPAVLPPLASVGVLFLVLHAGPECVALGRRLSPAGTTAPGGLLRLHRLALPLWLPVLAAVALFWPAGRAALPEAGPTRLLALWTLLACCVLTPAHEWLRATLAADATRGPSPAAAGNARGPRLQPPRLVPPKARS